MNHANTIVLEEDIGSNISGTQSIILLKVDEFTLIVNN